MTTVFDIIGLLASALRLLGMGVLGAGIGWLTLDMLHKTQAWQVQIAVILGLFGVVIGLAVFLAAGALGAFGIGIAVAIFLWGIPRKKKEEGDIIK